MQYLVCGRYKDDQLFVVKANMSGIDSADRLNWRERLAIYRAAYDVVADLNGWSLNEAMEEAGFEFVFAGPGRELGGLEQTLFCDGLNSLEEQLREGKRDTPQSATGAVRRT